MTDQTIEQVPTDQTEHAAVEATAEDAASVVVPEKAKPKRNLVLVSMSVPQNMKDILDKLAEEGKTTTANIARSKLAEALGIVIPAMKRERGKKYATEAERKEATAAKQRDRNAKASALLAALEAGAIDADLSDILARFAPKPRARKADGTSDEATPEAGTAETTAEPVTATAE